VSALPIIAAVVRRDWRIALSYRASFVMELASIFFFLALFFYLGRIVNDDEVAARQALQGDYFAFAAVGLALFRMVQLSLAGFAAKLREEQTTGTFETLLTAPVHPAVIVFASSAYDLIRGALSGLAVLVFAIAIFGLELDLDAGGLGTAVLAVGGSLALFAVLAIALAAVVVALKRATALLGLGLTALALLGGVYFPVEVLPQPLEAIAEANPFTWGLDVLRASLLGGDVDATQLLDLFAAVAVLLPLALGALAWALRRARQRGTLATY
jgi:ABC-2 type transport system permease protein